MAAEHQRPPAVGQPLPYAPQLPIQRLRLRPIHEPLAVGRVGHQPAVWVIPPEVLHVRHLEADAVLHARFRGVAAGNVHGAGVDVPAPDVVFPVELLVHGLLGGIQPCALGQECPFLRVKAALQPRGAVFGDERRFDGDGAAAAEGVAEGVAPPIAGQQHHGRRQRFPQGRLHAHGAVAPLIKPLAGAVQPDDRLILEKREPHLVFRPRFRKLLQPVAPFQPLHHGLFHDGLARGSGVKLAGDGVALHGEGAVLGDIVLPSNGLHPLKQLLKAAGGEFAQHQQHPCATAEVNVEPCAVGIGAVAENAPVFHPDILQPQPLHLVAH